MNAYFCHLNLKTCRRLQTWGEIYRRPLWTTLNRICSKVKVNSVKEACTKCFVVHILRFEIWNHMKKQNKNHQNARFIDEKLKTKSSLHSTYIGFLWFIFSLKAWKLLLFPQFPTIVLSFSAPVCQKSGATEIPTFKHELIFLRLELVCCKKRQKKSSNQESGLENRGHLKVLKFREWPKMHFHNQLKQNNRLW